MSVGINRIILSWLSELAAAGHLVECSSILEFGPQDFFFSQNDLIEAAAAAAHRSVSNGDLSTAVAAIFQSELPHAARQARFYELFGLSKFASADPYDQRADYLIDLNVAVEAPRKFDVIADFGTAEHVFNIGNVFSFTHNSLNKNGLSLKVLPTFGDNTHGFYNIHPTVYFDVARENGYEIIDFRYVDDMIVRGNTSFPHSLVTCSELHDGLKSFSGSADLQAIISSRFLRALEVSKIEGRLEQSHNTVDYCFVAMRKMENRPFTYPGQGVYLTEFPAAAEPSVFERNIHPSPEEQCAPIPVTEGMSDETLTILFGAEFRDLWRTVQSFTMVSEERAFATYKACRHVATHDIPGDFIECGVYRGGMAILAWKIFERYSRRPRRIWLFDTFTGMTSPEAVDVDRSGLAASIALESDPQMCLATVEEVVRNLRICGCPDTIVKIVKGDVLETLDISQNLPEHIAVLRLDTDWHASTKKELAVLYPLLSVGGIGLIDDYGHWLGARQAVDAFALDKSVYLARTDSTGIEFVKIAAPKPAFLIQTFLRRLLFAAR
jgi:hypothetical protein